MTPDRKRHIEEIGAFLVLALLLWWVLKHAMGTATAAPTVPAQYGVPPLSVDAPAGNLTYNGGNLGGSNPVFNVGKAGGGNCGCEDSCPVSPYTIGSLQTMANLGVAYANAITQAGNQTIETLAQMASQEVPGLTYTIEDSAA